MAVGAIALFLTLFFIPIIREFTDPLIEGASGSEALLLHGIPAFIIIGILLITLSIVYFQVRR